MVSEGDGDTGRNQQNGVDQWQLPGADYLFRAGEGSGIRVDHQRPLIDELGPEHVGHALVALTTEPRSGEGTHIKECAEERGEEHHLGKDEPAHAHAEGTVHLRAVEPLAAFLHHVAEPAEHHVGDHQCTGKEDPFAEAAAGAGGIAIHHAAGAKYRQQQGDRGNDRPFALGRNVIGFVIGHLLFSLSGNHVQ